MFRMILAASAGALALGIAAPADAQYTSNAYPYGGYVYPYGLGYQTYPYRGQVYTGGDYRAGTWGYNPYAYGQGYAGANYRPDAYGPYGLTYDVAARQCTAAVEGRLETRTKLPKVVAALVGADGGRVVRVTDTIPRSNEIRVKGLASSNSYGPFGMGAYGVLGYSQANVADLEFRCDVNARGAVTDVDIRRRD